MKSFIKLIPFILIILYYSLVKESNLSWSIKFLILVFMILCSVLLFLKSTTKTEQKKLVFLFLGLVSVCIIAVYFYI